MTRSFRPRPTAFLLPTLLGALAACGGSGGGGSDGSSGFRVLSISVPNNAVWQINRAMVIRFSEEVDFSTVNLNTIQIAQPGGTPATGDFQLVDPHTVLFQPACPTQPDLSDSGLQIGGVPYAISLLGTGQAGPAVRSMTGRPLAVSQTVLFTTPTSATLDPTIVFFDPQIGPPIAIIRTDPADASGSYLAVGEDDSPAARRYFELRDPPVPELGAEPPPGFIAPLNLYSAVGTRLAIVLALNQPVDPSAANVNDRNLRLEYFEAPGWIDLPHQVELVANCVDTGARLRITPLGILPQGRTVRVRMSSDFKDLVGETNLVPITIGAFEVGVAVDPGTQTPGDGADQVLETFQTTTLEDSLAATAAPSAIWGDGVLEAGFAFDGTGGPGGDFDWEIGNPAGGPSETVELDTTFTSITNAQQTRTQAVINGRLDLRNMTVHPNGTLVILGPNPVRILCSGTCTIAGKVIVRGANNRGVNSFCTQQFPEPGAAGNAGGGAGGTGSPLTTQSDSRGGSGFGAFGGTGGGGQGGESGYNASSALNVRRPGGGGGGTFGADVKEVTRPACPYQRIIGLDAETGFRGSPAAHSAVAGLGQQPRGGAVGPRPFFDSDPTNDFWGTMRLPGGQLVLGELEQPWAGAGGGGGGDSATTASFPTTPFTLCSDQKGAGGGGGGGSITVLALGDIRIGTIGSGTRGSIDAGGGTGGGGENVIGYVNRVGGGSGGGSGGHIVLQTASQIDLFFSRFSQGGGLYALGGQGGAGAEDLGGAKANGQQTVLQLDALPPNSYPSPSAPCAVVANQNGYPPAVSGAHPFPFNTNSVGNGDPVNVTICAGGDGGPGLIQLHVPTLADIIAPPDLPLPTEEGLDSILHPPPVGSTRANVSTPTAWGQLLPIFGRFSISRSKWISLGAATVAPGTTVPEAVRFEFEGTDPATGLVERTGAGATARVAELPPILSGTLAGGPVPPFVAADQRTVVFDAGLLADDIYLRNTALLQGFALELTQGATRTLFDVGAAVHDAGAHLLRVTVAQGGTPLAAYVPGDAVVLRPRFFRVVTDSEADALPASSAIKIEFQTAPVSALGGPDETQASPFVTDPALISANPSHRFVRFQVTFDILADGSSLTFSTPIPSLEFFRLPFRF